MKKLRKNTILVFIIGSVVFGIGNSLSSKGFHFESTKDLMVNFLFYQAYAFLLGYSNMYYFALLERKQWNNSLKRIFVGIFGSVLITLLGLFVLNLLTAVYYDGYTVRAFLSQTSWNQYAFGVWITLTIVIIFHLVYFYNRYQQNKIKEQKVIAGTASAKFDALKNQLDPHFLFNSLNVLTSLIEENPDAAQKFTTSLSKVYRYVLEQKNKELVGVEEELLFAKTYMSLLKMRFEESIVFSIPDQVSDPESKVVPLSLQLLLENAVKHNMVNNKHPLHIKIYEDNGYLVVENNLQPKQIVGKSSGVGLSNIKQRYQLLTDKQVNINQQANRFAVAIPMLTKQVSIMETINFDQNGSYERAKKKVEEIKGFYSNVFSYLIVIPFLIFINYRTSWEFKWFWFPLLGWGIGIAFHAFGVYGFGKSWEERKIQQILDEEERKQSKWS